MTNPTPTTDDATAIATVVDAYLGGLNETDAGRRAELVRTAWAEDGKFFDPLTAVEGHEAIGELAVAAQGMFPGARFVRTSGIDSHHSIVRFGWALVAADGSTTMDGIDVGVLGADGRLTRVAGFFGPLPEAA